MSENQTKNCEKQKRLEKALRENLRKRKTQQREREENQKIETMDQKEDSCSKSK